MPNGLLRNPGETFANSGDFARFMKLSVMRDSKNCAGVGWSLVPDICRTTPKSCSKLSRLIFDDKRNLRSTLDVRYSNKEMVLGSITLSHSAVLAEKMRFLSAKCSHSSKYWRNKETFSAFGLLGRRVAAENLDAMMLISYCRSLTKADVPAIEPC